MPIPLLILQIVPLLAVIFLLLRKQPAPEQDPRLTQLAESLPAQLARFDAHNEALNSHVRSAFVQMRTDIADEAKRTRESSVSDFAALRTEITANIAELSKLLNNGLNDFRSDNKTSDETLREAVRQNLDSIAQRLSFFIAEVNRNQLEAREALHTRLNELSGEANTQQEKLRFTVAEQLQKLNTDNTDKLDKI